MPVTKTDIISIPVSNAALKWAAYTSLKKYPTTYKGFIDRSPLRILESLFQGDVAKSALIEYLQSKGVAIKDEYDKIRKDNFKYANPLGYHFIANDSKIEANSSIFAPGDTRSTAIYRDIKVTASNYGGPQTLPLHLPFNITVQMYFDTPTDEILADLTDDQLNELSKELSSPDDDIVGTILSSLNAVNRFKDHLLGYGWATRNDIDNIRTSTPSHKSKTWTLGQRTFWNCKITDTNTFNTLHTSV